jgi:hypothetical protein
MSGRRPARRRVGARRRRSGLECEVLLEGFADFDPC